MTGPAQPGVAGRLAVSSAVATATDLAVFQAVLVTLTITSGPVSGGGLLLPTGAAALAGALVNFTLNRRWVFRARDQPLAPQAARYGVSVVLNYAVMAGSLLLISALGLAASIAWFPAKLVTWLAVSYAFQKYVVFRPARAA